MNSTTSALMLFKGTQYRLGAILGLLKQAPPIEVKPEDINPIHPRSEEDKDFVVSFSPATPEAALGGIVFYKQEGKFTVLLGHQSAIQQMAQGRALLKGHLISGPSLKKTRLDNAPIYDAQDSRAPASGHVRIEQQRSTSSTDRPRPAYNSDRPRPSYDTAARRFSNNGPVTRRSS